MADSSERKPATVLVVEDDDQVRAFIRTLLKQDGYEVLEAASGPDGLALARARGPAIDLLVCDMLLPELSGYDLAEQVHAQFPNMALLLMTGYVEGDIVQRGVGELGAVFLDKPFQPAVLRRKVREAIGHSLSASR
ncbi:MAG TPA: response regulator [Bryobacteraceae bacterium]|nr:response regulator [Bryobacteraceae bacterium]